VTIALSATPRSGRWFFLSNGQWIGGEELRLYLFFGSAVSSWLDRNTLDSSELSCHEQQQEMAQGGFRFTPVVHIGVHVHDHFIPHGVSVIPNSDRLRWGTVERQMFP
jgi:hypothetical protein